MFNTSDKVVCIDDSNQKSDCITGGDKIIKDKIYVVRDIRLEGEGGIYLVGVFAGYWFDGEEATWNENRFRKLEDIKEENRLKNVCKNPDKEYIKL